MNSKDTNLSIVQHFFQINTTYAISNLADVAYRCLQQCKNKSILNDLKNLGLFKDKNIFLAALHEIALDRNTKDWFPDEIKKTPPELKLYPQVWMYYSFFNQLNLSERHIDEEFDDKGQALFLLPLYFHKHYIKYQKSEQAAIGHNIERKEGFYEIIARTLTRISDILIHFYNFNNQYLNKLYFPKSDNNLFNNFFYILNNNADEANSFFIHHDKKLDQNYTSYKNQKENIKIPISMSRILPKGGDEESETNPDNGNIKYYILNGERNFHDLIDLNFQTREYSGGGLREKHPSQHTEEDRLLYDSIVQKTESKVIAEDRFELDEKYLPKTRSIDIDNSKNIPNGKRQKEISVAFSAKITKTRLLLQNHYLLPPLLHISEFLTEIVFKENFYKEFNEEDFFRTVFLLNICLGMTYAFIIKIFFGESEKKDIYPNIYYDDGEVTMTFDTDKIYSKKIDNNFFVNSKKRVNYYLPRHLVMLVKDIQKKMTRLEEIDTEKYNSLKLEYQSNSKYKGYVEEWVENFSKRINISINELWRIQATYRTKYYSEDLTSMLCTSVYQPKSLSGLPYSSTNQNPKEFTIWLEELFQKLDGSKCVSMALNIIYETGSLPSKYREHVISGSNRILKEEEGRKFFNDLYQLIIIESDNIKYFNLLALYLRYSMSLLVGTRDFFGSSSFKRISFETKTLVISEKSQALLSGARVIPLCPTIVTMIEKYIKAAETIGINDISDVMLFIDNKAISYKTKISYQLFTEYNIDYFLLSFIETVPLNVGRHVMTHYAIKDNINDDYVKAYKGHYFAGAEQFGIFSTFNIGEFQTIIRQLNEKIAGIYGIK